ncbi:hypothetical protein Y032_0179g724 [Ancylostoma ceylanicum]|uniref:Uncharacterized protein n=1 Tax=Ancylostoma ceylanicum TaxID=53326 RepID=A0A016STK9_9BILA|nr:hypothetical protein Y032_0179g724 [Ancylostoma ceylanicum]
MRTRNQYCLWQMSIRTTTSFIHSLLTSREVIATACGRLPTNSWRSAAAQRSHQPDNSSAPTPSLTL